MAKRAAAFGLMLGPHDANVPTYRWLCTTLRTEILEGRLRPGARLPATRDLAVQYGLSRGTIVNAFDQLKSEGYIQGTIGSGTYVNAVLPDELLHAGPPLFRPRAPPRPPRTFSAYGDRVTEFPGFRLRPSRAFRSNVPALDQFPIALWAQLSARLLRRASPKLLLGSELAGHPPLRAAVADYLTSSRGVKCTASQVIIVSGVQAALDLAVRLFVNRGDRVCMEDPGYPGAASLFDAAGATIATAAVDEEGMALRPATLRRARLVYVTPAHQFPLGVAMSLPRRLALLEWASKTGALVFEDDYDSEYRYSGRPIPALQGLDRTGQVLFAGSFSKVLFPSLRLGYLVVPDDLIDRFTRAISLTNRHAPLLDQAVLCDFITQGHFGRHLRRMRQLYAERLSVLIECARHQLTGLIAISPVEAGLQTIGWLADGIDGGAAAAAAAARNVDVIPLRRYHRGAMARDGLQLGFAAVGTRELRRGVNDLASALAPLRTGKHGKRPAG
jgi:GntR family transcriptional regulator/MocR family aminotransferase